MLGVAKRNLQPKPRLPLELASRSSLSSTSTKPPLGGEVNLLDLFLADQQASFSIHRKHAAMTVEDGLDVAWLFSRNIQKWTKVGLNFGTG